MLEINRILDVYYCDLRHAKVLRLILLLHSFTHHLLAYNSIRSAFRYYIRDPSTAKYFSFFLDQKVINYTIFSWLHFSAQDNNLYSALLHY